MTRRYIDVHAHLPVDVNAATPSFVSAEDWDPAPTLARMDRLGIATQLLSHPAPPISTDGHGDATARARRSNDGFAAVVARYPTRFGAYATLPLDSVTGALAELERAMDRLKLDGVCLASNSAGRYLGTPFFAPLLAEIARRGVPLLVHPMACCAPVPLSRHVPPFLFEFPVDTARTVLDAVYAGVFQRHPALKMIVAHCGGALPSLAWRITHLAPISQPLAGPSVSAEDVEAALRNLYYDTALSCAKGTLDAVLALAGPSQIVFGTDCGAAPDEILDANARALAAWRPDGAEADAVARGNARRLFARLREAGLA